MDSVLISPSERERLMKMLRGSRLDLSAFPRIIRGISYGSHHRQKMTVFLPELGKGPFPGIVFLHGGGWESGHYEDSQVRPLLPAVKAGYAVISCGYRLLPDAGFPDNLFDVKTALAVIYEHGTEFGVDPSRLMISGASAGAMLALCTAYTENMPQYCGGHYERLPRLAGCIDFFGPVDFANEDEHFVRSGTPRMFSPAPAGQKAADRLLRADTSANPSLLSLISPVGFVHPDIPPTLILHGRNDPMVSCLQSQELHDTICRICGPGRSRLVISEETTHADIAYENEPYTAILLEFIQSCFSTSR